MSVLDGPGEGTWSVFALKAVEERDEAREALAESHRAASVLRDQVIVATHERDEALDQLATAQREVDRLREALAKAEERDPDDPEFDATDFAHPAWWRAHDYVTVRFKQELDKAREEAAQCRKALEEQSRLILEAEERGARWALIVQEAGDGQDAAEMAREVCQHQRAVGLLRAVFEHVLRNKP